LLKRLWLSVSDIVAAFFRSAKQSWPWYVTRRVSNFGTRRRDTKVSAERNGKVSPHPNSVLEKIIALVVDHDEGWEIFDFDFQIASMPSSDIPNLDLFDAILREPRRRPTD